MESLTFYGEWLPLDKKLFRILVMLADVGEINRNLSDIYRYLVPEAQTVQTKQRNGIKEAIEELSKLGFLTYKKSGRNYDISKVPQKQAISVPSEAITALRTHRYSSEAVAWEQVLKVYLWICRNQEPIVTYAMIAEDLNISKSTVGSAKKVLLCDFNAIACKKISEKTGSETYKTLGQEIQACAWWDNT